MRLPKKHSLNCTNLVSVMCFIVLRNLWLMIVPVVIDFICLNMSKVID